MKRSIALHGHHSLVTIAAMSMAGIAIARQEDPQGPHLLSLKTFDDGATKFGTTQGSGGISHGNIRVGNDERFGVQTKMVGHVGNTLSLKTGAESPAWLQDANSFAKTAQSATMVMMGAGTGGQKAFAGAPA
ncbi:MAG: hypothetical protein R3B53_03560 [Candidatus Paceibacterota bacterium]